MRFKSEKQELHSNVLFICNWSIGIRRKDLIIDLGLWHEVKLCKKITFNSHHHKALFPITIPTLNSIFFKVGTINAIQNVQVLITTKFIIFTPNDILLFC